MKTLIYLCTVFLLMALQLMSCSVDRHAVTDIMYTNIEGDTYPESAVPGQAVIMFTDGVDEVTHHRIIEECRGEILEYYPLLDSYLIKTGDGKEMDFILSARNHPEVEDVHLNSLADPMSIDMHIMDDFTNMEMDDKKNGVCLSHGDYCSYAAKTAYPDCPDCINIKKYDFYDISGFLNYPLSKRNQKKFLNDIFEQTDGESLILINMSFGRKLGTRKRQIWAESSAEERNYWIAGNIDDYRRLANNMLKLKKRNPNFIVARSAGNDGCHVMDQEVFSKLEHKLSPQQLDVLQNHVLFVSAKDDDFEGIEELPIDKTKLYAYYANSPAIYCSYMTMVDITHLGLPGTSFSSPFLLGKIARLFDIDGYRPLGSTYNQGRTVIDIVNHVKEVTQNYALNIQQPGLYSDEHVAETYYYNRRYTFTGTLKAGYSDLYETGEETSYYYLEIDPIDIQPDGSDEFEEPLTNVTRLQIVNQDMENMINREKSVSGYLLYHIAGSSIHTDAYLTDVEIEGDDNQPHQVVAPNNQATTYYYQDLSTVTGVFHRVRYSEPDEFSGEEQVREYFYLSPDSPVTVKDKNEGSRLPALKSLYDQTELNLYGEFNPESLDGSRVTVSGKFTMLESSERGPRLYLYVREISQ